MLNVTSILDFFFFNLNDQGEGNVSISEVSKGCLPISSVNIGEEPAS